MSKRILVIAPHPDDEILGVGGSISRFSGEGREVFVVIVTKGYPPLFDEEFIKLSRKEALDAHKFLGVKDTIFLDFPAANLDTIPKREINKKLLEVIEYVKPEIIFIPFNGDLHMDHQVIFNSALVSARTINHFSPKKICAYETLSETNWNAPYITPSFTPNLFIDISDYLYKKIEAMKIYKTQLKTFPHERSLKAIKALAHLRGSTVRCKAAEAFIIIREIMF